MTQNVLHASEMAKLAPLWTQCGGDMAEASQCHSFCFMKTRSKINQSQAGICKCRACKLVMQMLSSQQSCVDGDREFRSEGGLRILEIPL